MSCYAFILGSQTGAGSSTLERRTNEEEEDVCQKSVCTTTTERECKSFSCCREKERLFNPTAIQKLAKLAQTPSSVTLHIASEILNVTIIKKLSNRIQNLNSNLTLPVTFKAKKIIETIVIIIHPIEANNKTYQFKS